MPTYDNTGNKTFMFDGKTIRPGDVGIESLKYMDHMEGIVRTADVPHYRFTKDAEVVQAAGPGFVEVLVDPNAKVIRITNSTVAVEVHPDVQANPGYYPIGAGQTVDLENDGHYASLWINFEAAGELELIEIPE